MLICIPLILLNYCTIMNVSKILFFKKYLFEKIVFVVITDTNLHSQKRNAECYFECRNIKCLFMHSYWI
jgi:hypothetical protein